MGERRATRRPRLRKPTRDMIQEIKEYARKKEEDAEGRTKFENENGQITTDRIVRLALEMFKRRERI